MIKRKHFTERIYAQFAANASSSGDAVVDVRTIEAHLARVRELSRYKFTFVDGMWLIFYRARFAGVVVQDTHFSMHQGVGDQQDARQAFKDQMPKLIDKYLSLLEKHVRREVEREARRQTAVVPKAQPQAAQQPGKSKNRNRRQQALQPA